MAFTVGNGWYYVLNRRIGLGNGKPTSINKQNGRQKFLLKVLGVSNESFDLNEINKLENISLPTAAVKDDTNILLYASVLNLEKALVYDL